MTIEANTSISHGTLRYVDLIPTFWDFLRAVAPETNVTLADVDLYSLILDADSDADFTSEELEGASELLNSLLDILNDLAPEGCYFGASEGDGSDFGFWYVDTYEHCDRCGCMYDSDDPDSLFIHAGVIADDDTFPRGATVRRINGPAVAMRVDGVYCNDMVACHYVGDDERLEIDRAELTRIDDDDYCGSCGQIGCGWH